MYKIELRHYQTIDDTGVPYRYEGTEPNTLTKMTGVNGVVPVTAFFDATNDITNLDSLKITWRVGSKDQHMAQTISDELRLKGESAIFVKDWISDRAYSPLNIVECRIIDKRYGTTGKLIGDFLIKPQKIGYDYKEGCELSVTVVQNDLYYDCISRTPIHDNHNLFMNRLYRAYDYCVEKRPATQTAVLYMLAAFVFCMIIPLIPVSAFLNALSRLVGAGNILPTLDEIKDAFFSIVGFGRAHAAASAREYTHNVCEKCGVIVDEPNNFLFKETITHRGATIQNPFFWMDILFCSAEKGKKNGDPESRKLQIMNIPNIGLSDLYNDLTKVFNAKWYITTGGKLRFLLRQDFANAVPIFDFSDPIWLSSKRLLKLRHDITDKQQPLTADFGYQQDSIDLAGNDAKIRYNSRASYDSDGTVNPNLKGNEDNTVPFGATAFRDDGVRVDYIHASVNNPIVFIGAIAVIFLMVFFLITSLGLLPTLVGSVQGALLGVIVGFVVAFALLYVGAGTLLNRQFVNAIVMSQDVAALPKLLIRQHKKDGGQFDARVEGRGDGSNLIPNTLFNPLSKTYTEIHDYNEETPELRNYPMFFDTRFQGNIYDICWRLNDSRENALSHRETAATFVACDDDLDKLGVYDGQDISIDERFRFPQTLAGNATFVTNLTRIEEITIDFNTRIALVKGSNTN